MIGIVIVVAAAIIGIRCLSRRARRARAHEITVREVDTGERQTSLPEPPSGPPVQVTGRGWSLVPVETSGSLTAVRPSDPTVHPSADIIEPKSETDVN